MAATQDPARPAATSNSNAETARAASLNANAETARKDCCIYECNICFEVARQPVVSFCGHLFCWPCIYRWFNTGGSGSQCPVCKAMINRRRVIPVLGKNEKDLPHHCPTVDGVPARPAPLNKQMWSIFEDGSLFEWPEPYMLKLSALFAVLFLLWAWFA